MLDDKPFIRAIVNAPGDEAPRLVYADLLDERGDPRGAYLRAEAEWAKSVRLPHAAGDPLLVPVELLRLKAGLDPVWVARVSRPPVGVCCTHFRLLDPGPPASEAYITAFERRHGIALPAEYRAFLLNYNGGRIDLSEYGPGGEAIEESDYVFCPLTGAGEWGSVATWVERREADFDRLWDPMYGPDPARARAHFLQFINIGRNPDYIYSIHLGVAGPVRGQVRYFDYSGLWQGYPDDEPTAAETFAAYLVGLP